VEPECNEHSRDRQTNHSEKKEETCGKREGGIVTTLREKQSVKLNEIKESENAIERNQARTVASGFKKKEKGFRQR